MAVLAAFAAAVGLGATPASATVVTVTLAGSEKGSVTSVPAGIDCSNVPGAETTDCSFDFPFDFSKGVKLTAVGAGGAAFRDWSGTGGGTCSGSVNPCETGIIAFDPLDAIATFAPKPESPVVTTGPASDVEFPSAELSATVNPNSSDFSVSDCYIEYGPSTDYGFKDQCRPGPGSGTAAVSVTARAGLLKSGTTYHYRVVAVNAGGTSVGEDRTFRSAAAPADPCPNAAIRAQQGAIAQRLPDCYAYELVSPSSTAGQNPYLAASNPAGDDVLLRSGGGFLDVENLMNLGTTYRARRTAAGWETEALGGPPAASFPQYGQIDWTADWWREVKPRTMWPARPVGSPAEDLQAMVGVKGGEWVPLSPPGETQVAATDANLSGVVLNGRQRPQLTDGSVDTRDPFRDSLTVSYRQPNGALDVRQVARQGAAALFPDCNVIAGSANGVTRGAVRREGLTRVVFTTAGTGCIEPEIQRVWVSEPFSATPDAFDASASRCTSPCGPAERVEFVGASLDTERIFMTTTQRLVDADVDATADLYEYNFRRPTADRLQLVTGDATPAELLGVVGVSDSGSHVYFTARGALADAEVPEGNPGPVAGSPNLYVRISGPAGQDPLVRFVGTLAEEDSWGGNAEIALTGDGRFLAFGSVAPLTPDKLASDSLADVYRFDAVNGELRRLWVSDPAHNGSARVAAAWISGGDTFRKGVYANYELGRPATTISRDGDRILFSSNEPLFAGDTNNAVDYFLWSATDGSVAMVSDGRDSQGVRQAGMSPDGDSIFIATASRLVPQHTATSVGLYAVRRGGGFPVPVDPEGPCVEDSCQGPMPAPHGLPPVAGSVTFHGQGNAPGTPPTVVSVSKLKSVTGTSATLKVKVPAAGRITAAGSSIRKVTRSATKSATYSLRIRLSSAAKRSLTKKKSLRVTVKVTFAPKAGPSASKSVKVTFKQPKAKKKSSPAKTSASYRSSSTKGGR